MSSRALGIVLVVVGVIALAFGFNSTDSVADQVSEGFTGRFTDNTMIYLIGGGALAILGVVLALRGPKARIA